MDDMGWRDLSCMGSSFYETPNIDRIASEGMLFTDAYAACPVCSPTRASILSGKYPARVGLTDFIDNLGTHHPLRGKLVDAPYVKQLPLSEYTLASALRDGGYHTFHVGKWHLGMEPYWPEKHGFDVNIGGCQFGHPPNGYFCPWKIPTLAEGEPGEYLTDRLTDEALKLLESCADGRPFFLNLWYYSVHVPIQAKEEKIAKYKEKAVRLGLDRIDPFSEGEFFHTDDKYDKRVRRRLVQSDPVYAAMIESVDENIGRILHWLDDHGLADDTVVVFTSDNGGLATAEGSPTCNSPLSEGKGWMYDGGVREPLLVRYPGMISRGAKCSVPVISPDFYPTLLELAGLPFIPGQHIDGVSIVPLLKGEDKLSRDAVFWHYPHYGNQGGTPGSSVRCGDWKLIEFFEDGGVELYNLRDDPGERRNLAVYREDVTDLLRNMLYKWRQNISALIPVENDNPSRVKQGRVPVPAFSGEARQAPADQRGT